MSLTIDERPGNAISLCVLGSGSGGNASLVRTGAGVLMIDAGLGPRVVGKRMANVCEGTRLTLSDVRAVCLTHLDSDHFNLNWFATLQKYGIAVWCHEGRVGAVETRAAGRGYEIDVRGFASHAPFEPLPGVRTTPIAFAHDDAGSHGFVIESGGTRLGYATDLGRVPEGLSEHFCDLDLLAIESNYDRTMQEQSPRPWFLKQRIMNGRGHLSNVEAYDLVRRLFNGCQRAGRRLPRHVVLLHRSRECNCPELLRTYFSRDARIAQRLTLSEQHEPTGWLKTGPIAGEQLMLGWG